MSDDKGQMSGFSGFVRFSPLYYNSPMAAADTSVTQAERNPPTTGQVALFFLAVGKGGDTPEHPAPGCAGTRGPTGAMPVERVLKPVLLSEIHSLNDLFRDRDCSPVLQTTLRSSDSHRVGGSPRFTLKPLSCHQPPSTQKDRLKGIARRRKKNTKISFLLTFS